MATVLDILDTQMMDYPSDIDMQMQPSIEPWFQDEAAMQDETQYPFTRFSIDGDLVDVEIDMENYDTQENQNPEYEMIDEPEDYPVTTEVEDVMVSDALHPAPAPDSVDASTLAVPDPTEVFHPPHVPSSADELPAVMASTDPLLQAHVQLEEVQEAITDVVSSSELPEATDSYLEASEGLPLASSSAIDGVETSILASSDDYVPTASSSSDTVPAPSEEATSHPEGSVHEDTNSVSTALTTELTPSIPPVVESLASPTTSVHDATEQREVGASDSQPEPVQESTDIVQSAEDVAPSEGHEQGDGLNQEADLVDTTRDPHEISEGVYIDPPPAVLLSFAFADHPDVCLFNQPTHSDPSSFTTEVPSYSLLLHDCPTLYYEPLSSVFEALRHDGYLSSITDLSYLELVFDAYDLQLTVSEDNIFAREISLHDLNVLHDGSDISGPLRLQLRTVNPRFIARYRMLQDQIIRLTLAEEDDNSEGQEDNHGLPEVHLEQSERQEQDQENTSYSPEVQQDEYEAEGTSFEAAEQDDQVHGEDSAPNEGETKQEESHQDYEVAGSEFVEGGDDAVDEIPENVVDGDDKDDDTVNPAVEGEEVPSSEQNVTVAPVPEDTADQASPLVEPHEIESHEDEDNGEQFDDAETTTNLEAHEEPSNDLEYQEVDVAANDVDPLTVSENIGNVKDDTTQMDHASEEENQEETLHFDENYEESWEEDGAYEETEEEEANTTLDADADPEHESASVESSVTLSSKNSKRSIHDVDPEEADEGLASANSSPGLKRMRTE